MIHRILCKLGLHKKIIALYHHPLINLGDYSPEEKVKCWYCGKSFDEETILLNKEIEKDKEAAVRRFLV